MIRTKLSLLCFLFLLAACGGDDTPATEPPVTPPEEPVNPPGEDEGTNLNANPADEAHPYVTDLCIPRLNEANQYVEHTVSYREQEILNYALEWVEDKRRQTPCRLGGIQLRQRDQPEKREPHQRMAARPLHPHQPARK